jgi:GNAT superfamily N-acetyltransferase
MPDAFLDALDVGGAARAWRLVLADPQLDVLVAEIRGVVAGFCFLKRASDEDLLSPAGELIAINIDPPQWRTGVGSCLLNGIDDCARARGYREVALWVLRHEPRARRFYEARGFRLDGAERLNQHWGFPIEQVRYRRNVDDTASRKENVE